MGHRVKFYINPSDYSNFEYSEDPIYITEMARRIDNLKASKIMTSFSYQLLVNWLCDIGLMVKKTESGISYVEASEKGVLIGLSSEWNEFYGKTHKRTLINNDAQHYIVDMFSKSYFNSKLGQEFISEGNKYNGEKLNNSESLLNESNDLNTAKNIYSIVNRWDAIRTRFDYIGIGYDEEMSDSDFPIEFYKTIIDIFCDLISTLKVSDRQKDIYNKRVCGEMTLEKIGNDYNLSRERIRQLVNKTHKKMLMVITKGTLSDTIVGKINTAILSIPDFYFNESLLYVKHRNKNIWGVLKRIIGCPNKEDEIDGFLDNYELDKRKVTIAAKKISKKKTNYVTRDVSNNKRTYFEWEMDFPEYVVIEQEGEYSNVYGRDCLIINHLVGYEIRETVAERRSHIGFKNSTFIKKRLREANINYIIVNNFDLIEQFDGISSRSYLHFLDYKDSAIAGLYVAVATGELVEVKEIYDSPNVVVKYKGNEVLRPMSILFDKLIPANLDTVD